MRRFFRAIRNFFSKDPAEPSRDYTSHGEGNDSFTPKWGIIIPHTNRAQGANSPKKVSEYNYALEMVTFMSKYWTTRDSGGVSGAAKDLKKHGCNASLEPHKNAFNSKAKGFEILVIKGDKLSTHYAELLAEAFKAKHPDRILRHGNGVKEMSRGGRGYNNLAAAKRAGMEVALLSEAFFIDNKNEWLEPVDMAKFWNENLIHG